jgi:hypothetical protein
MQRFTLWVLILFSILTALAAGTHFTPGRYRWALVNDRGATTPLDEPALLAQPLALIARSVDTPLAYYPLAGDRTPTGILPYPDVNPRRWQVALASPSAYHIVWQEQDTRLRCALISTGGTTVRGPIELATSARPDFVTLPGEDGDLLVIWINNRTAELSAVTIDSAGRPGPISSFPSQRIAHVAAARDQTGLIHTAWLSSPAPDQWTIFYQASVANPLALDTPVPLYTFALAPGESIATLQMGLDSTHVYLVWSTTTAARPDMERVQVISFSLGSPTAGTLSEVRLPDHFTPTSTLAALPHVGRIDPVTVPPTHPGALRWPRPTSGQSAALPLAVALRTADGWRPAVVYFQHGNLIGFQVIAPLPADAGPPALLASDDLYAAWTGLDGITPHLYTAQTGGKGLVSAPAPHGHLLRRTLAGALVGIPLGLLWLVLPLCVVIAAPANTWTLPFALALYGTAKLLWPAHLFSRLPPLLAAAHFASARSLVEIAVLLIGLIATGVCVLAQRRKYPTWRICLIYPLVDAALTWLVFGANVFG